MIPLFTHYHHGAPHYLPSEIVAQRLGVTLQDLRAAARRTTPPIKRKGYLQWVHWPRDSPDRGIQIEEYTFDGTKRRTLYIVRPWGTGTRRIIG